MSDNNTKPVSFKDFRTKNPVVEAADAILPPVHDIDHDDDHDDSQIPALFASIHFRSPERPNGYSSKDMWEMNNAANAHLPHLQTPWPHGDNEEPPVDEDEHKDA